MNQTHILALLFAFLGLSLSDKLNAQIPLEQLETSELWEKYQQNKDDSIGIHALNLLGVKYRRINPDSAVLLSQLALDKAQARNSPTLEADALVTLGESYDIKGDFAQAITHLNSGLQKYLDLVNEEGIARAYNSRGLARYYADQDLDLALDDFQAALFIAEKNIDKVGFAKTLHNLAILEERRGSAPEALRAYLESRNLKDSLLQIGHSDIEASDLVTTLNNLGNFYQKIYQFDAARQCFEDALALIPDNEYARRAAVILNAGIVEELDSNNQQAQALYQEGLRLANAGEAHVYLPYMYSALGNSYRNQELYESAENAYDQALQAIEQMNAPKRFADLKAGALADKALLNLRLQRYEAAYELATEALSIAQANSSIGLEKHRDAHDVLAAIAEYQDDPVAAARHLRQYINYKTKLDAEQNRSEFVGLQAVMDVERAEFRHSTELKEQELAISEKFVQRLTVALLGVCLLAIIVIIAKVRESRAKRQIEQARLDLEHLNIKQANTYQKLSIATNKLQQFAFATGHDLKEALRNITSFTQLAAVTLCSDQSQAQAHLKEAGASGKRMRKLLDDLLHYSNVDVDDQRVQRFPVAEAVAGVKQQMKSDIEILQGDVHLTTDATLSANRTEIEQIFYNLIDNSLRYAQPDEPPRIKISLEAQNGEAVFTVEDNGIGVPKEELQRIFDPFVRLHDRSRSGSGLGLSIVRSIVENYGGRIWFATGRTQGSACSFTLPKAAVQAPELVSN